MRLHYEYGNYQTNNLCATKIAFDQYRPFGVTSHYVFALFTNVNHFVQYCAFHHQSEIFLLGTSKIWLTFVQQFKSL